MELLPHVDYDLLREHLQIRPEQNLYFFPEGKPAFAVAIDQLRPLSRAVVAPERARASIVALRTRDISETLPLPEVAHKRQGAFSLWRGARVTPPDERALPSAPTPPTRALPPSEAATRKNPAAAGAITVDDSDTAPSEAAHPPGKPGDVFDEPTGKLEGEG